jgi:hypothetical protein
VSWHNIEPTKLPYYLLWVGSPELMPFEVTHEVDSDYCVGLLDFDTPEEYAQYAKSVVDTRRRRPPQHARGGIFEPVIRSTRPRC